MKNWKTTLFGALCAVAVFLKDQPGTIGVVGQILSALSPLALGYVSADAGKEA